MVTTRVDNLRSSLPLNRPLFSLSHRMGEGWGEGPLRFMVTTFHEPLVFSPPMGEREKTPRVLARNRLRLLQ